MRAKRREGLRVNLSTRQIVAGQQSWYRLWGSVRCRELLSHKMAFPWAIPAFFHRTNGRSSESSRSACNAESFQRTSRIHRRGALSWWSKFRKSVEPRSALWWIPLHKAQRKGHKSWQCLHWCRLCTKFWALSCRHPLHNIQKVQSICRLQNSFSACLMTAFILFKRVWINSWRFSSRSISSLVGWPWQEKGRIWLK
jgi:hypothetical protein